MVREQYYIDTLKPYEKSIGFNLNKDASGGDFYSLLTEEEKIEFKNKCRKVGKDNGMYGKSHTESTLKSKDTKQRVVSL